MADLGMKRAMELCLYIEISAINLHSIAVSYPSGTALVQYPFNQTVHCTYKAKRFIWNFFIQPTHTVCSVRKKWKEKSRSSRTELAAFCIKTLKVKYKLKSIIIVSLCKKVPFLFFLLLNYFRSITTSPTITGFYTFSNRINGLNSWD